VSVRVLADKFAPSTTQKRLIRRNADLEVSACKPWTTEEQYALLRRYLAHRHPGGGMAGMDEDDFADMVEQSPVKTFVVEYREPSVGGRPGKLVGACLTDQQGDGLSMIYSFFDVGPDARQGLGTTIILDHITRAGKAGLPYVYLGYWVEGSERMAYKARFKPLERLTRDGWQAFDPNLPSAPERRVLPRVFA
jgi:arginine-tRNA-protein transferase